MELSTYVRKPFLVEATEITKDNIEEIAEKIGTLKHKGDGEPWIQVDPRVVDKIRRVYVGFWLTEIDGNYRCYSPKAFNREFVKTDEEIMPWVEWMNRIEKEGQDGTMIEHDEDKCPHGQDIGNCATCDSLEKATSKRIETPEDRVRAAIDATLKKDEEDVEPLPAAPADGSAEIPPGGISGEVAESAPEQPEVSETPRCSNCRSVQLYELQDPPGIGCSACGHTELKVESKNVFDKPQDAGLDG